MRSPVLDALRSLSRGIGVARLPEQDAAAPQSFGGTQRTVWSARLRARMFRAERYSGCPTRRCRSRRCPRDSSRGCPAVRCRSGPAGADPGDAGGHRAHSTSPAPYASEGLRPRRRAGRRCRRAPRWSGARRAGCPRHRSRDPVPPAPFDPDPVAIAPHGAAQHRDAVHAPARDPDADEPPGHRIAALEHDPGEIDPRAGGRGDDHPALAGSAMR